MKDLQQKLAIISGGSSGINLALAQLLVKSGCNVLIAVLRLHPTAQEWIQTLSQTPESSSLRPGKVEFVQTNVISEPQLERTLEVCNRVFNAPCPDIVVPGAGIYESLSSTSPVSFWADTDMDMILVIIKLSYTQSK